MRRSCESGALVAVEERMIADNEEAVGRCFARERRKSLLAEDVHAGLSNTGVQCPLITDTRHSSVPRDHAFVEFNQLVLRQVNGR